MGNEHGITTQYSFQEREQFCDFGGGVFLSSLVSHRAQKKTFQIRSYRSLSLPLGGAVAFLPVEIFCWPSRILVWVISCATDSQTSYAHAWTSL